MQKWAFPSPIGHLGDIFMGNYRKKSNSFFKIFTGALLSSNLFLLAVIAVLLVILVALILVGIAINNNQNAPRHL